MGTTRSDRSEEATPWIWGDLAQVGATARGRDEGEPAGPTVKEQLKTAFQQGHARGRKEGEAAANQRLRLVVEAAEKAVQEAHRAQHRMLSCVEPNTAAMAVAIARHLIVKELATSHEIISDLVREAISSFGLGEELRIKLNPADLALIAGVGEADVSGTRSVTWIADPEIQRGGCMVEGPDKIVDGRLDLALERVFQAISHE